MKKDEHGLNEHLYENEEEREDLLSRLADALVDTVEVNAWDCMSVGDSW